MSRSDEGGGCREKREDNRQKPTMNAPSAHRPRLPRTPHHKNILHSPLRFLALFCFFFVLFIQFVVLNFLLPPMSESDIGSPAADRNHLIVVAPTFYPSLDDPRLALGLACCRAAARHNVRLILVDGSPEGVRARLRQQGGAQVFAQQSQGKKGAALREAIQHAVDALRDTAGGIVAFQEPEKVDMIHQWRALATHMMDTQADICVPRRSDESFKQTYPIEQYHSENFANLHLDALAAKVGFPSIDWTMGPIAFRKERAPTWLEYDGDLWDAQIVPMVRAQRRKNAKVVSFAVDFHHPPSMKQQEEGMPEWSSKRLFQLNNLFEIVGKELS